MGYRPGVTVPFPCIIYFSRTYIQIISFIFGLLTDFFYINYASYKFTIFIRLHIIGFLLYDKESLILASMDLFLIICIFFKHFMFYYLILISFGILVNALINHILVT